MTRAPVREIDLRYLVPMVALGVFVSTTLIWGGLGLASERRQILDRAVLDWERNLSQLQSLLGVQAGTAAQNLLNSFNDTPGLRHLVAIDAGGVIVHANRQDLVGRPASELAGLDRQQLGTGADTLAVGGNGHIHGYYRYQTRKIPAAGGGSAHMLLYLDMDTAPLIAPLRLQLLRETGIFALLVFCGTFIGVLFVRRYVVRPLTTITEKVVGYRPGQSMASIPVTGTGPLSRLARAFEAGGNALSHNIATLKTREERLSRILESIGDGVIITDAEGRIERLNAVAERLTGWTRTEARGLPIDEVFAPFDDSSRQPLPNPVLQALETETVIELANHAAILARNGELYQIADTAAPIRAADGTIDGVALVFHDVSEAYRLREEQRIAAVAFETAAPQLIADGEGRVIRVNRACLELGGFSREEMLNFGLIGDVFIGQDSPGLKDFLAGKGDTDVWSGPTWWRTKAGKIVHLWVTDTIIRGQRGEIANYVISALDTTEIVASAQALAETRASHRLLIDALNDGVAIIQDQRFVDCNERLARFIARSRDDILNRRVEELSLPQQLDGTTSDTKATTLFEAVMKSGAGHTDWSLLRPDGIEVVLEATLSQAQWQGSPALLAVARDITERRRLESERQDLLAALQRSEDRLRQASAAYGIATWEVDPTTDRLSWTQDADTVLGIEPGLLPTTHAEVLQLIHPEDREAFDVAVRKAWQQGVTFRAEYRATLPGGGGKERWFRSQGECRREDSGSVRLYGATADISEYRRAQEDIQQLAFRDPLTDLANRRLLLDRLEHALKLAHRSGQWGAVLFVDLDRFKLLNDSLGHAAGDALLLQIAQRCTDAIREADTVARLGGDEFVILVTNVGDDERTATQNTDKILAKLRARFQAGYPVGEHEYHVTASIGVALFPRDGDTAEELLRHADVAMYQVKQGGRDAVAFYQPKLQRRANRRLALERELRTAIEHGQLILYYQPKLDVLGTTVGAEALIRWQHPERGLVPPLDFIPLAEETGLIYPIGRYVVRTACEQLARWHSRNPERDFSLALNISPHQFRHPEFLSCVTEAVSDFGVAAGRLIVEVTESAMLEDIDLVIARMRELKAQGIDLSVDDFGTGYSSLYYLKNLPLDEIKIDQSYVRDLLDDANDAAIVESIIAIARNLRLRTVAEGVETAAQAERLQAMGCTVHQGYLYSRPLPLAEFEAYADL